MSYLNDYREWAKLECVCKALRDEVQRIHWARLHSLTLETLPYEFKIDGKKKKNSTNGSRLFISFLHKEHADGTIKAVSQQANNLREVHLGMAILTDDNMDCASAMIRCLRFEEDNFANIVKQ